MELILSVTDKTQRTIYLTRERYDHILKHPEMHNRLQDIQQTLEKPQKITDYPLDITINIIIDITKQENPCLLTFA